MQPVLFFLRPTLSPAMTPFFAASQNRPAAEAQWKFFAALPVCGPLPFLFRIEPAVVSVPRFLLLTVYLFQQTFVLEPARILASFSNSALISILKRG